uniref:Uncharacterized protein n=1 Tax=Rhizophora mucronata TaxID=61149 RepID=A0A2P2IPA8_RHIMU
MTILKYFHHILASSHHQQASKQSKEFGCQLSSDAKALMHNYRHPHGSKVELFKKDMIIYSK